MEFKKGDKVRVNFDKSICFSDNSNTKYYHGKIGIFDEYNIDNLCDVDFGNDRRTVYIDSLELIEEEFVIPEKWYIRGCGELVQYVLDYDRGKGDGENISISGNVNIFGYFNYSSDLNPRKWNHYIDEFPPNSEITFEQFEKYILNKKETMYKYTPEYCKIKENEVVIYCLSSQEVKECDKILDNNSAHSYLYSFLSYDNQGIVACDSHHGNIEWFRKRGYDVIKAEDFIKNNKKETVMDDKSTKIKALEDTIAKVTKELEALKNEPDYKPGDYIVVGGFEDLQNKEYENTVHKIKRIDSELVFFNHHHLKQLYLKRILRKATPEEIKAHLTIKIGGYEVVRDGRAYKIGCKSIDYLFLGELKEMMIKNKFTTISLDKNEVSLETIEKMLEMKS